VNPYVPPSARSQATRPGRRPPWLFITACVFAVLLVALVVAGKVIASEYFYPGR
jgi:Na+/melibiose symporter-like transporter